VRIFPLRWPAWSSPEITRSDDETQAEHVVSHCRLGAFAVLTNEA